MARVRYNPHHVTTTERLAFRFKSEPKKIIDLIAKRRFRNSALLLHEQKLRYTNAAKNQRVTATEFQGGDRPVVILATE